MPPERDVKFLDALDLIGLLFHPRKHHGPVTQTDEMFTLLFEVDQGITLGGRFYRAPEYSKAPNLLFFHGNGEIATDYDNIAPMYQELGINLTVFDYRGYGQSTGTPSFSSLQNDIYSLYPQFRDFLTEKGYSGSVSVMGRSLGSGPAQELASHFQEELHCLIIESGFANTYALLQRLGIPSTFLPPEKKETLSMIPLIRAVKIPLLIIHGEQDQIIPLEEGLMLYRNTASDQKEILIIPNAGHNDLLYRGREDYMAAISNILFS